MPGADTTDGYYVFAYGVSKAMLQVLKQCEGKRALVLLSKGPLSFSL
jgi:hypothetical protein